MTFAPLPWRAPRSQHRKPESRFTSRSTLAPFVMRLLGLRRSASARLFCALTIEALSPAAVKAFFEVRRSCVSQRTDDFVSGSSTPTSIEAFELEVWARCSRGGRPTVVAATRAANAINFFTLDTSFRRGPRRREPARTIFRPSNEINPVEQLMAGPAFGRAYRRLATAQTSRQRLERVARASDRRATRAGRAPRHRGRRPRRRAPRPHLDVARRGVRHARRARTAMPGTSHWPRSVAKVPASTTRCGLTRVDRGARSHAEHRARPRRAPCSAAGSPSPQRAPRARRPASPASLRAPSMPTMRAIASWPTSVSRQPRAPQTAELAVEGAARACGRSRPRSRRPRGTARRRRSRAPPTPMPPWTQERRCADAAQRAALELAERGEVAVVVDAIGNGRVVERLCASASPRRSRASRGSARRRACRCASRRGPARRRSRRRRRPSSSQRSSASRASSASSSIDDARGGARGCRGRRPRDAARRPRRSHTQTAR